MKNRIKKPKIAVLVGQLTVLGGVGITAVNEVRYLRKLGIDACLVILWRKKEFNSISDFEAEDIPVIFLSDRLPKWLRINFKFFGFSFFSFFHLSSIIWAPFVIDKYDAILVHETYNCFSAIACAKKTKAKLLFYLWDPVSYIFSRIYKNKIPKIFSLVIQKFSEKIDCFLVKKSDVVVLGSSLHENYVRAIDPLKKIVKIPSGTKILEKIKFEREPIVVALTKWDRGKNPDFLLEAVQNIKTDFKMIIAGNWTETDLRKQFLKKISQMGLKEKISVSGKITDEEKFKLFSQARVLVHPIVEAFGMMVLEAAGSGCSYIIPKGCGVAELFTEGEHGFLFKEGDIADFSEKLNLLLENKKKSALMGEKAYFQAKKYSWESHAKNILNLII